MGVVGVYNFDDAGQRNSFINDIKDERPDDDHRKYLLDGLAEFINDIVEQSEEFEETIDDKNKEISDAEDDNNELQDENDKLTERVTELEEELEKFKNA